MSVTALEFFIRKSEIEQGVEMKILVAIDGSKDAGKGAELALNIAKAQGAEVLLLAIIPVYPGVDLEITARARDSLNSKLSAQLNRP